MADGLCGPSNALQNFQKHSTADRTLQQDRLTAPQAPSQGFRSSPGPNAGILDAEFQAFQAGQPPLQPVEQHGFQAPRFSGPMPPQMAQPSTSGWADDFQRMNLSSPPPLQQHNVPQAQSQSGWQHEFFKHQQMRQGGASHAQQHAYNAPVERLSTLASFSPGYQPMYGGQMAMDPNQGQQTHAQAQSQAQPEIFDEEAFARAFDEFIAAQAPDQEQEIELNKSAENFMDTNTDHLQPERIGADLIHDPNSAPDQHTEMQQDPDALARTAGDLLNRVQDNQSDKFKNSNFLQLMRSIRDKEVTVEGDKMVDRQGRDIQSGDTVSP